MTLEIDNVELSFSKKTILNGIYLKAETGKITGILGRNGCGKSSLLEIIFGRLKPKYKLVRVNKKPILKPLYLTKLVKYLPQNSLASKQLKLKTAFKLYDIDWNVFENRFKLFSKYKHLRFSQLSGGEQRVVEIYLTLKSSGKIVLLDEPFSHIAPLYIEHIKSMLNEEKHEKVIIITDHYYKDIIDVSDTLYLIHNKSSKLIKNLSELEDHHYLNIGSLA